MDTLAQELAELKGFITDLKADRAAHKEKERRESWTKYVSMSIVFIAVLAAIATQYAGKYSGRTLVALNDATFNQALASDQWSSIAMGSICLVTKKKWLWYVSIFLALAATGQMIRVWLT